ncbi:MAG: hypothetical protein EA341_03515 [Mongoliibacter sp.]|uniref:hypothetical protein n=1 Tax=Mongoliibacter sp. TaxID=2022438 RepID=UPI0012EFA0FB|nr:hypothetical protein [Mongoliibacter sp.]TVP52263.1 MAG: hypothetical protein EA341_03515 [Mongoliibacter sp.]
MIQLFRKIRQKLLQQNKIGSYLKYAIGEIFLVVIGILIALQVNTWNLQRIEIQEKSKLIKLLQEELKENLKEFESKQKYMENSRKKNLILLEISSGESTSESIDSIRSYAVQTLAAFASNINSSRLTASKESGKFSLLNEEETKALAEYETALNNYKEAISKSFIFFTEDGNELMIRFGFFKVIHPALFNEENFPEHNQLVLSDSELFSYLRQPETYRTLHKNYLSQSVDILWLRELIHLINGTLEIFERESYD